MRTTIEIKDKLRAELLKRAAHQGDKGFSHIIEEALESYFGLEDQTAEARKRVLRLKGSFSQHDADQLRSSTEEIRRQWR
jgi:hypothetical protein